MSIKSSLMRMFKLLTFRISREEILAFNSSDLYVGLFFTWVVGMGRYWDDPQANLIQHLGGGSLLYVFVLAGLLWLILKPFNIEHWRYKILLTFVCLTALPALIYAIPVERFFYPDQAAKLNAWFLAFVAIWRVALLFFFLRCFAQLTTGEVIVGTFLPITFIVSTLTMLNLERAVFDLMGGIRETSHDTAYLTLILLTVLSVIAFIPLFISYCVIIHKRKTK